MRTIFDDLQAGHFENNEFLFALDPHDPNQGLESVSSDNNGRGACGPFFFERSKEITQYIVDFCKDPNFSDNEYIDFLLPLDYQRYRNRDSRKTRRAIRNLMFREWKAKK
jgi:hypothetical protein